MAKKKREVSVTGTKRGLGLQFAKDLAELGISVMLTDAGEQKKTGLSDRPAQKAPPSEPDDKQ